MEAQPGRRGRWNHLILHLLSKATHFTLQEPEIFASERMQILRTRAGLLSAVLAVGGSYCFGASLAKLQEGGGLRSIYFMMNS